MYTSKDPLQKIPLLKYLLQQKYQLCDISSHLAQFFETLNKLLTKEVIIFQKLPKIYVAGKPTE